MYRKRFARVSDGPEAILLQRLLGAILAVHDPPRQRSEPRAKMLLRPSEGESVARGRTPHSAASCDGVCQAEDAREGRRAGREHGRRVRLP